MKSIETEFATVKYDDSDEMARRVFERVIKFFKDEECFSGESIQLMDSGIIESPIVLSEIADDIIKFEYISKE